MASNENTGQDNGKASQDQKKKGCVASARLLQLRNRREWSRKRLGNEAKVSPQTITRLELTRAVTGTDTLVGLADALGVSCDYLLGRSPVDLDDRGLGEELKRGVEKFVEKLLSTPGDPMILLNRLSVFLDAKAANVASAEGISKEEEVLGLWWSILSAYEQGKWDVMTNKADNLITVAMELGRTYLAALGHAYKAKALRNKGGTRFLRNAETELKDILEGEDFQSLFTCRMIGKLHSRQGLYAEALHQYEKAEKLLLDSFRDDLLFLLEKTKLHRNMATVHGRLAHKAQSDDDEPRRDYHLTEAHKYIVLCENSIKELKSQIPQVARVEEMLLARCYARYFEVSGKLRLALRKAKEALELAETLSEEEYAARVRMHLFHLYMLQGNKEEAVRYFGSLFPLERYRPGRFGWHYSQHVEPHRTDIMKYITNQYAQSYSGRRDDDSD